MKLETKTLVIGAGVGGLGAACWMKRMKMEFLVIEAGNGTPMNMQNGVHYLHSKPELPFDPKLKKMTLTDGVLLKTGEISTTATINHALQYSEKVREIQHPSSIMEIGKKDFVFMTEDNTMNSLVESMYKYAGDNFLYQHSIKEIDLVNKIAIMSNGTEIKYESIISTIPLGVLRAMCGDNITVHLSSSPIFITNYKVEKIVPNWMINLYVPDLESPIYRASILNGICSVESIRPLTEVEKQVIVPDLLNMFYLDKGSSKDSSWPTGKVISISKDKRAELVDFFAFHRIYSIGRFGLWNRKLLIDSTINQAAEVVAYLNKFQRNIDDWNECRELLVN